MAFFPRQQQFWLYHGLGLGAYILVSLVLLLISPQTPYFNLLTNLVLWPPLFTLAVLGFRHWYHHSPALRQSITRLIIAGIGYGALMGLIIAGVITALLLPFLWPEFTGPDKTVITARELWQMALPITLGMALNSHLFLSAWIFIYGFIVQSRRARKMEINNLQLQNSLKEARLNSLSSQLNPHFIFNALNNIRFVIHENPRHADRMITALSDILRHSLTADRQDKITLAEEMDVIDRYISIVKLQHEDRLAVVEDIPDVARRCLIPPMSLHLLVENAIKHGFENLRSGGTLRITATTTADRLTLQVINPVNPERPLADNARRNTGTGLDNITHRLRLLYGEQAQLETRIQDNTFIARLALPRETLP